MHDSSYKNLFSHAELVKDLLQGFVHEPWVTELDFDSLERINSQFTSDSLNRREEDVIWRIKWRDRWLYLYLLLAFQSTDDTYMALRVMVYVGLLYQYLIREKQIKHGEQLPPVLPIVLYNGERPWKSVRNVQDLIQPVAGFEAYIPKLTYFLLDERHYQDLAELSELKNLVAAIFKLEQSQTPQDIKAVVLELLIWLDKPEQESIRRSFAVWLNRVLLPRRLPTEHIPIVESLNEVKAMLAETVQRWYDEAEAKGEAKGLAKGKVEGEIKGVAHALLQLLEIRFGTQSESLQQQLYSLSKSQLEHGLKMVFNANSVEEIVQAMQTYKQ